VTSTFAYSWKVDLTESIVAASPDWSFRFLPSGAVWNGTGGQEISSAQFSVVVPPESTTTTTSTTSTTTTTSTSTTSTATKTPSPTPTPTPLPESDDGLSTGAKAGIGIGAAAGAILLIGLFIFFWRRRKGNKEPIPAYDAASDAKFQPAPGYASLGSHSHSPSRSMDVHEVPTGEFQDVAVVGKAAAELGGGGAERAEMDAGVHGGGRGVAFELEGSR
jgi:hypothetical protein